VAPKPGAVHPAGAARRPARGGHTAATDTGIRIAPLHQEQRQTAARPFAKTVDAEYWLYAATVFVSSFLLFAVQPLIGKHVTPWFGGSAAAWITAMFFFMVVLGLGYLYALALSRCSRTVGVLTHMGMLLAAGATLALHAREWPSAITPLLDHIPIAVTAAPVTATFVALALSIGLPFLMLSSTSSLLQYWYGTTTGREPFSLYAVSNAGSLLGLLSYPLLFEPLFSTYEQGLLWSVGFVLYGVLSATVALRVTRLTRRHGWAHTETDEATGANRFLIWVLLASVPVATMLTATSYVSSYIASVPFLWIIPLALYLISFIVSFRSGRRLPHSVAYASAAVFAAAALVVLLTNNAHLSVTLLIVFVALFAVCHPCHEALYAMRPPAPLLPRFYLALSAGGIFGSTLVLVSSLYLLPVPIEFSIIVAVSAIVNVYFVIFRSSYTRALASYRPHLLFSSFALLMVGSLAMLLYLKTHDIVAIERNFFGYKAIHQKAAGELGLLRLLVHGTTEHGHEYFDSELEGMPVSYYAETSGISYAFEALRGGTDEPLRVAVLGLGSGALAALCRNADRFEFFEIDPQVVALAKEHFTYLDRCPGSAVQLGDARLSLGAQHDAGVRNAYDLIVLDAYADDMMPIHLMTAEAVAMYTQLLTDDGILAIHISSRYLDLSGVVRGLAEANDLVGRYHFDSAPPAHAVPSRWTLLAKHADVFAAPQLTNLRSLADFEPRFWSDTYSALWPVVNAW
jgi:hypothetical protein